MKVCFIGGNLEPGRSGVGDYARKLARACAGQGTSAVLVSLADSISEVSEQDGIIRLPRSRPWGERIERLGAFLAREKPDWVSLQWVPYAYDPKGLPFRLADRLASLKGDFRWQVTFHELSTGKDPGASIKDRVMGCLQDRIMRDLMKGLAPVLFHTHSPEYRDRLNQLCGRNPRMLELFSNIDVTAGSDDSAEELVASAGDLAPESWRVGLFGSIYPGGLRAAIMEELIQQAASSGRPVALVQFGVGGERGLAQWNEARAMYGDRIRFIELGQQPEEKIAALIRHMQVGLATTPWTLVDKSGTVASFNEAGKPVWVTRNDVPGVAPARKGVSLSLKEIMATTPELPSGETGVDATARRFLADLKSV